MNTLDDAHETELSIQGSWKHELGRAAVFRYPNVGFGALKGNIGVKIPIQTPYIRIACVGVARTSKNGEGE
jgi:hypothetical protein